jgi:pyridoxine kinase
MPSAAIFSSYVVSSRVGGMVQALALGALGIEAHLVPSVLFGRHPGFGAPGGGGVGMETYRGVLEGAEAQGLLAADLILTGYFALPEQVEAAAAAIDRARGGAVKPIVLVDPIMGDEDKGLYVKEEVAAAIADLLVPRADVLAPNLWELERLTGGKTRHAEGAVKAAKSLKKPVLVSSVPCGPDQIGVLYVNSGVAWLACHARVMEVPKGTGDLLSALFAAALIEAVPPQTALVRAVGGVADAVEATVASGLQDLPIASLAERLKAPLSRVILSAVA